MALRGDGGLEWMEAAECSFPEYADQKDFFFSQSAAKKDVAKAICYSCPVRWDCAKFALENAVIWGMWGGRDENEIRRALSLNSEGNEARRSRYPQCPYCSARTKRLRVKVMENPDGGRWATIKVVECMDCRFSWKSRTSANAVTAYFNEVAAKTERRVAAKSRATAKKKTSAPIRQLPSTGTLPGDGVAAQQ